MADQQQLPKDQEMPNPLVAESLARSEEEARAAGEFVVTDKRGGKGKPAPLASTVPSAEHDAEMELLRQQAVALQAAADEVQPTCEAAVVLVKSHDGSWMWMDFAEATEVVPAGPMRGNDAFLGMTFILEDLRQGRTADLVVERLTQLGEAVASRRTSG